MTTDPFAGIQDEPPYAPLELRRELLASTRRAFAKIRKVAVQRPRGSVPRASIMADLVRSEPALDLWMLTLALEPVLGDEDPLPLSVWAELAGRGQPLPESTVSRSFGMLEDLGVIQRARRGRHLVVRPLMEDGSGDLYVRPGQPGEAGPGFFTIPHEYWNDDYVSCLKVPGKVALLIGLSETTQDPTFEVATTRAEEWYGISERTLERGYLELSQANLLLVKEQVIRAPRSTTKHTVIYHRALSGPFALDARQVQQADAVDQVGKARARAGSGVI